MIPTGELFTVWYILTGAAAGLLGAVLGLGGGVLMVPILTVVLGLPIKYAVAASLVGVVATSVSSTAGYMKRGLPLVRLGLTLELTTVAGAVAGSVTAGLLPDAAIRLTFAVLLLYVGWNMWRGKRVREVGGDVEEIPANAPALAGSAGAGVVSGLLGVGGGIIKVPILNLLLKAPIHRSTSTSTFMMGLTAAAGCIAYHVRGELVLAVAAPLALGVLTGGRLGPRVAQRIRARGLQRAFVGVLLFVVIRLVWDYLAGGGI